MPKLDLAGIQAKRQKMAAQLADLERQEQAEIGRRNAIAGEALLAQAAGDPAFEEQIRAILDRRVRRNEDRALLGLPPRVRQSRRPAAQARDE